MPYDMSGRSDTDSPHHGGQAVARAAKIPHSTSQQPSLITLADKSNNVRQLSGISLPPICFVISSNMSPEVNVAETHPVSYPIHFQKILCHIKCSVHMTYACTA